MAKQDIGVSAKQQAEQELREEDQQAEVARWKRKLQQRRAHWLWLNKPARWLRKMKRWVSRSL